MQGFKVLFLKSIHPLFTKILLRSGKNSYECWHIYRQRFIGLKQQCLVQLNLVIFMTSPLIAIGLSKLKLHLLQSHVINKMHACIFSFHIIIIIIIIGIVKMYINHYCD